MFINWAIMLIFISLLFMILFFILFYFNTFIIFEYNLMTVLSFEYKFYILLDWMSTSFSFAVLLISGMVLWYSHSYMKTDKNKSSFCWMVLLFILSMLLLILMPNAFMLILGWDGLGLVSYCLVIFYQSVNSYNSGMMTIISNRIGDVMVIMMIIFSINFNSFDLMTFKSFELIWGMMIIIAGLTKSAQIPFSAWLPAAMAAPTPVSALVHSSTLVTAGVYLLIRFDSLFINETFSKFLLKISLMTMVMSGLNAFFENDLKKIIAFSTLSQLSIMMVTLALNLSSLAFFHLIVHAIFKSMLFLCAGFIIHNLMGNQDIRFLPDFFKFSPTISSCMTIGMFSLMGIPFIGGFYSKDVIMEYFFMKNINIIEMLLFSMGIIFTFLYNIRLGYMLMFKGTSSISTISNHTDIFMKYPILILTLVLIMMSNYLGWFMIVDYSIVLLSLLQKLTMLFLFPLCVSIYLTFLKFSKSLINLDLSFFMKMWYMSELTSHILLVNNKHLLKMSINDWTWMELCGPLGIKKMIENNYNFILLKESNTFMIVLNLIIFMIIVFF
uniref:NADH dehydrogenase subunit 5 n=1 Tax=Rhipicephalus maculatus TaxID=127006 RepID=UPI0022383C82|nr:NADH dehydrogenase subunit 5 [Rhipicephalus maculatus]QLD97292.1 NADH dehydrogenase subunit 5 [Rhipicephalus maculatus]UYB78816.1 NADH dehydrogenase subunit 5 [Rhipicephalus maculatus]